VVRSFVGYPADPLGRLPFHPLVGPPHVPAVDASRERYELRGERRVRARTGWRVCLPERSGSERFLQVLRNPGPIARGTPLDGQCLPPEVPAGLPSALLERRPDIRQAEQTLVAANARIGMAKAEYFPKISLTGMLGVESVSLSDLFTGGSRFWSIGPTMTVPLFTAGRTSNTVKGFEARQQQAATQYLQTIQQAFREVEDALVFHRKVREIRTERERRVAATRRALSLATLRYERGLSTQLDVLDAQRQLFSAELDLASTTRDQLTAVVQLYKALGGGWQSQPPAGYGQSR
jgi:outer membrane protein, multidrug efflux system